jgi:hypothetical protein
MKKKINLFALLPKIIIFIKLVDSCLNNCPDREKPILLSLNDLCVMKHCTKQDFENKICIKGNNIIETQWLNNIIKFGEKNSRFTKIANYLNGDLIVFSALQPGNKSRYFYGLKNNGRPLFIDNGKETSYMTLNLDSNSFTHIYSDNYGEGEIIVAKMGNEEFPMSFGKRIELYDFNEKNVKKKYLTNSYLNTIRISLFKLKDTNTILYGGIFWANNQNNQNNQNLPNQNPPIKNPLNPGNQNPLNPGNNWNPSPTYKKKIDFISITFD